jgi:cupin fold WbuC family metalloprotein
MFGWDNGVQVVDQHALDALTARAKASPRLRQHQNLHESYQDPCQRLLNAVEPGSYLQPKRDVSVPRSKLLTALRGRFALLQFDEDGNIMGVTEFAAGGVTGVAVEIAPTCWSTVISMKTGSVLLEVRPGPFDPDHLGDFAPWAPEPENADAAEYLRRLEAFAEETLRERSGES